MVLLVGGQCSRGTEATLNNQSNSTADHFIVNNEPPLTLAKRVWTVADAQANLPEVLRLAEAEGPQYIGSVQTRGG